MFQDGSWSGECSWLFSAQKININIALEIDKLNETKFPIKEDAFQSCFVSQFYLLRGFKMIFKFSSRWHVQPRNNRSFTNKTYPHAFLVLKMIQNSSFYIVCNNFNFKYFLTKKMRYLWLLHSRAMLQL